MIETRKPQPLPPAHPAHRSSRCRASRRLATLLVPGLVSLALLLALAATGCGGRGVPELALVPATALLHVHFEMMPPDYLVDLAGASGLPLAYTDALVQELGDAPFGVTLLAIDISELRPQFLVLSRRADRAALARALAGSSGSEIREAGDRTDLLLDGYPWASVADRDGWTALYIGRAPEVALRSWLELDPSASLASDTLLSQLVPDRRPMATVLLPRNLLDFLRVAPIGRWVPAWRRISSAIAALDPAAAVIGLDLEPFPALEVFVARAGDATTTRLRIELEDDALQSALPGLVRMIALRGGL
ncbi:hypothetical protein JW921_11735 [Candidatus Fermentibacterales bacterium]|nr:hypothetical protein [Candidatus Fermentibacterales bacterium]